MVRTRIVPLAVAFVGGVAGGAHGWTLPLLAAGCAVVLLGRALAPPVRANVTAALALGITTAVLAPHAPDVASASHAKTFGATVLDVVARTTYGTEVLLRLDAGVTLTATLPGDAPDVGDRLVVRGRLEPLDEARNPGEPSPRELGAERGIDGALAKVAVLVRAPPDPRDATLWIPRARAWASRQVHAALPEPDATILAGALWGEKGALPPDLRAEFQDTGTMHVLVTAGLHLGVIAWLAVAALQALGCGRVASSLGAIVLVWCYAAFSGAHLPSLRAATMLSFGLGARAAGREALSWNALAAAAVVVAMLRPASVGSLSFDLSFSCVGAIVLFAKPFAHALERACAQVPEPLREALALTFATQVGTWPLTAAGFLVFAPYAPLANAAVVPVVGVAMLVGLVELVTSPMPFFALLCANVETSLLDWIVAVVHWCSALPGAHVIATPPPAWTIAAYDVALFGVAALLHHARPRAAVALFAAACALCAWPPRAPGAPLVVSIIDVGQADAIFVRTPRGHAYLVDGGGRLERGPTADGASAAEAVGERVAVPFLVRQGVHHLDAVLLSHPHGDHTAHNAQDGFGSA